MGKVPSGALIDAGVEGRCVRRLSIIRLAAGRLDGPRAGFLTTEASGTGFGKAGGLACLAGAIGAGFMVGLRAGLLTTDVFARGFLAAGGGTGALFFITVGFGFRFAPAALFATEAAPTLSALTNEDSFEIRLCSEGFGSGFLLAIEAASLLARLGAGCLVRLCAIAGYILSVAWGSIIAPT